MKTKNKILSIITLLAVIAFAAACDDDPVNQGESPVTQTAAKPAAAPAGGNYSAVQTVMLTSATAGADIYYTLDRSEPTAASAKYSASISISTTWKAIAVKAGMTDSDVMTEIYTITSAGETEYGSVNFNDAKWSNIDVYTSTNSTYTGDNIIFTKVRIVADFQSDLSSKPISEITGNTTEWLINITNNKLSVKLGTPSASYFTFPDGINITDDLQLFWISGFVDAANKKSIGLVKITPEGNGLNTYFVYANKECKC